jgi:hypothetical protein
MNYINDTVWFYQMTADLNALVNMPASKDDRKVCSPFFP